MKQIFILLFLCVCFLSCSEIKKDTKDISINPTENLIQNNTCPKKESTEVLWLGFTLDMTKTQFEHRIAELINLKTLNENHTINISLPSHGSVLIDTLSVNGYFEECYLKKIILSNCSDQNEMTQFLSTKYGMPKPIDKMQAVFRNMWREESIKGLSKEEASWASSEYIRSNPLDVFWENDRNRISIIHQEIIYESILEINRNKRKLEDSLRIEKSHSDSLVNKSKNTL